jgi:hypothetical protein
VDIVKNMLGKTLYSSPSKGKNIKADIGCIMINSSIL